ncbi:MAG: recombination protein RecR [Planctomycetes bacterium]|nr:recombination protein RecR [Planctomycetota bacterium]
MYPKSIEKLISSLKKFPGIGERTAERLVYYIIHQEKYETLELADAIKTIKDTIKICDECCTVSEQNPCEICVNKKRDKSTICIVEQPKDLWAIEKAAIFSGLYHVLHGAIAPLDGVYERNLTITKLLNRLHSSNVKETIIATNPTIEGEATFSFLVDQIKSLKNGVKISRIARGIPYGYTLEYQNPETIKIAIEARKEV